MQYPEKMEKTWEMAFRNLSTCRPLTDAGDGRGAIKDVFHYLLDSSRSSVNTMAIQVGNWKGAGGWYENLFLVTLFLTSMPLASSLLLETGRCG